MYFTTMDTPTGALHVVADAAGTVHAAGFGDADALLARLGEPVEPSDDLGPATKALHAYFDGDVHALDGIAVQQKGGPFLSRCWELLREIPPGETISYGELARRIGQPSAARAVGLANGSNPLPIVVPCHRVIGADGSLTGFGGGIERKRWLLAHEARYSKAVVDLFS